MNGVGVKYVEQNKFIGGRKWILKNYHKSISNIQ